MSGVNEIRSTFLDYFKKNGHEIAYRYLKPCDYLRVIDEVYGL